MEAKFKKDEREMKDFDTIVIGGGASGMMAAIQASESGERVLILEKNEELGRKLTWTGGGRCNILNLELDEKKLLKNYGEASNFLYSPFSVFGVKDSLEFFKSIDLEIVTEERKRAFPKSNSARDVRDKLLDKILKNKVKIIYNAKVEEIVFEDNLVSKIKIQDKIYTAKKYIIATGGLGKPETGSTGDGFKFLQKAGIKINEMTPDLLPVISNDTFIKNLSGKTIENIKITFFVDDIKKKVLKFVEDKNGESDAKSNRILFTHFGLSGPTIINNSKFIKEYLKEGSVSISIDLFPKLNEKELDDFLLNIFENNKNKKLKNVLKEIYDGKILEEILTPPVADATASPREANHDSKIYKDKIQNKAEEGFVNKSINSISKEERKSLVQILKNLKINIDSMASGDKAIVSDGGIDLREVNFKNMSLYKIPNLFVTGDLLDISRPSGGFSLQLCWTTGYIAGSK